MAETTKPTVLVVDDEPEMVSNIKELLEFNNYSVIAAYEGSEAIDKARRQEPDLILLDIMLPKINGYKVCKLLKADVRYQHIPIILFSAYQTDRVICESVGCDAFVPKPFENEELVRLIAAMISGEAKLQKAAG